ncbi:glycosyltransferase family 4 protein [Halobacteriovorax sp. DPLXC-1]|uniref:glycosyltransferase family 4 protein n=1 Tax=Halobacteriovorax sp. DPLXC-1 TaxID=3110771 RepID=UPI002FF13614
MKISIFTYVYKPESFLINELAEFLAKNNQVEVLTGLPNYSKDCLYDGYSYKGPYREKVNNVTILRYPIILRKSGFIRLALNYITSILSASFSVFRLRKSDIAFVFATSPIFTAIPAIFFAKFRGAKVVIWLQDLWPESFFAIINRNPNGILGKFLGLIVRWIYRYTDLILIQSNDFRTNLEKYNYRGRIEWIPNWAKEVKSITRPLWVDEIPSDKFVITFAGNIGVAQKLETLIEAVSKLNNNIIHLAIVGDGREKENLENKYKNNEFIRFYGRKPTGDMTYLFEKSDALAVVLKNDPAFSLVVPSKVQSYLMAKKPILASLNGAGANLIKELSVGLVAPAENVDALAKRIDEMINLSTEERQKIAVNAYQSYEKFFSEKKVISRVEELLKSLVNS